MQKSIRSSALIAILTLAAVPAVRADQTGCNPHPQVVTVAPPSTLAILVSTVVLYLGA
jgi:hypothetical protein